MAKRCSAITKAGNKCRASALTGSNHCLFHSSKGNVRVPKARYMKRRK